MVQVLFFYQLILIYLMKCYINSLLQFSFLQDAKSDRVKQLLKETEKYLQKLGSKLRDAKAMNRCFETDMDDTRSAGVAEKNEMITDNEDETDQAKVSSYL